MKRINLKEDVYFIRNEEITDEERASGKVILEQYDCPKCGERLVCEEGVFRNKTEMLCPNCKFTMRTEFDYYGAATYHIPLLERYKRWRRKNGNRLSKVSTRTRRICLALSIISIMAGSGSLLLLYPEMQAQAYSNSIMNAPPLYTTIYFITVGMATLFAMIALNPTIHRIIDYGHIRVNNYRKPRKKMTADERRDQLIKQGFKPKTCWCLDCDNVGLCNLCDGKATQNQNIPPQNYRKA